MNGAEPIRAATLRAFAAKFAPAGFDPAAFSCVFGLAENCLLACGYAELPCVLRVARDKLGVGDRPMPDPAAVGAFVSGEGSCVGGAVGPAKEESMPDPAAVGAFVAGEGGCAAGVVGPALQESTWLEVVGCPLLPNQGAVSQVVRIVHPTTRAPLTLGTVGEIWIAGASVARGYWQLDDVTEATFRARLDLSTPPDGATALWPDARLDLNTPSNGAAALWPDSRLDSSTPPHGAAALWPDAQGSTSSANSAPPPAAMAAGAMAAGAMPAAAMAVGAMAAAAMSAEVKAVEVKAAAGTDAVVAAAAARAAEARVAAAKAAVKRAPSLPPSSPPGVLPSPLPAPPPPAPAEEPDSASHALRGPLAPHLRTGDLGFVWERRLYVVGRIKDVLTVRGRTLHASDVEACAESGAPTRLRPGCCAAFALDFAGGSTEERLVLVAELRPEAESIPGGELEQLCQVVAEAVREREAVRPAVILLLRARSILKTTSGKLRRRDCREAYLRLVSLLEPTVGGGTGGVSALPIPVSAMLYHWRGEAARLSPEGEGENGDRKVVGGVRGETASGGENGGRQKVGGVSRRKGESGQMDGTSAARANGEDRYESNNGAEVGAVCVEVEKAEAEVRRVLSVLSAVALEVCGSTVGVDAPLMEAGLDSAALAEFQGIVSDRLGLNECLSETLFFDHPTLRQLARAIAGGDTAGGGDASKAASASEVPYALGYNTGLLSRPVVVASAAGSFPMGTDARLFRRLCACGGDAVGVVPAERWESRGDGMPDGVVGRRARHGASHSYVLNGYSRKQKNKALTLAHAQPIHIPVTQPYEYEYSIPPV